jgi:hypothetical protein
MRQGRAALSPRGDRSFLTYLGEVNREYLGIIVIELPPEK